MAQQIYERIEDKLDKVAGDQVDIKVHIAEIKKDLRYHIKRTDLLEADIKPVKKHVATVQAILKILGLISIIAAIAESLFVVLQYFKK